MPFKSANKKKRNRRYNRIPATDSAPIETLTSQITDRLTLFEGTSGTRKENLNYYESWAAEQEELKKLKLYSICTIRYSNCLLLPCCHLVTCGACAQPLSICPVCGTGIRNWSLCFLHELKLNSTNRVLR